MDSNGCRASVAAISNLRDLTGIESAWNGLAERLGSPYLLHVFFASFMEMRMRQKWRPLVLAVAVEGRTIGIAPLMSKRILGLRYVRLFPTSEFSNFLAAEEHSEVFITAVLDFLFKEGRCSVAEFSLPEGSAHADTLESLCAAEGIGLKRRQEMGHCLLRVQGPWAEYEARRGRSFRRRFKRAERDLDQAGRWMIRRHVGGQSGEPEVIDQVLGIEKSSWKEEWRVARRAKVDRFLLAILEASRKVTGTQASWMVHLLELDGQPIAYCLINIYGNAAFLAKSSYDQRYKKLSPGIFVLNSVIRELFDRGDIVTIDFLTDMSYHHIWADDSLPRVRMLLTRGLLATLVRPVLDKVRVRLALRGAVRRFCGWPR